jgi:hypothetical protein
MDLYHRHKAALYLIRELDKEIILGGRFQGLAIYRQIKCDAE